MAHYYPSVCGERSGSETADNHGSYYWSCGRRKRPPPEGIGLNWLLGRPLQSHCKSSTSVCSEDRCTPLGLLRSLCTKVDTVLHRSVFVYSGTYEEGRSAPPKEGDGGRSTRRECRRNLYGPKHLSPSWSRRARMTIQTGQVENQTGLQASARLRLRALTCGPGRIFPNDQERMTGLGYSSPSDNLFSKGKA